jgi:hypothetical protein
MASEFCCQRCAGQSIVLPEDFSDDAHITCRTCGAFRVLSETFGMWWKRTTKFTASPRRSVDVDASTVMNRRYVQQVCEVKPTRRAL